jgi:ring-1,2-phenylacetyl-CoA epoxidase subunit PaaE
MGFIGKIFKKKSLDDAYPKGFSVLKVKALSRLTKDSVQLSFDVPEGDKQKFFFIPGQYVNLAIVIDGEEYRRSYSICSGPNQDLAIAIKKVENGKVSTWANDSLSVGDDVLVSFPQGSFNWKKEKGFVVAFVAGSGITPVLSIAKALEDEIGEMRLFYGNKSIDSTMFYNQINDLKNTKTHYSFSQEKQDWALSGRLTKEVISNQLKQNLMLLKADVFYLCGPEQLIKDAKEVLTLFGVSKDKIQFELFTTPILLIDDVVSNTPVFKGESEVTVHLDNEEISLKLNATSLSVLDALNKQGYDPPYSCRGGVCCTCKAKVTEGSAMMKMNFSLTDQELSEGYVLTCQCYPTSEKLVLTYDF